MSWRRVKKNAGLVESVSDKMILARSFYGNSNAFKSQAPALHEGKEFLTKNACSARCDIWVWLGEPLYSAVYPEISVTWAVLRYTHPRAQVELINSCCYVPLHAQADVSKKWQLFKCCYWFSFGNALLCFWQATKAFSTVAVAGLSS